jgi:hypothetical protein
MERRLTRRRAVRPQLKREALDGALTFGEESESIVLSERLRQGIETEYQAFLASSGPDPLNLRVIARTAAILPVVRGWEDLGAIRLDGTPVVVHYEAPHDVTEIPDRMGQYMLLGYCAARFPRLAEILPDRPPDAVDCELCQGSGRNATASDGICLCGGLGWLAPSQGAV